MSCRCRRRLLVAIGAALLFYCFVAVALSCSTSPRIYPVKAGMERGDTITTSYGQRMVLPHVLHQVVYRLMEECTGRAGDLGGVTWAVADSLIQWEAGGHRIRRVWGLWNAPRRLIVLDRGLVYLPSLISHESLHDLFRGEIPPGVEARCGLPFDAETMRTALGVQR